MSAGLKSVVAELMAQHAPDQSAGEAQPDMFDPEEFEPDVAMPLPAAPRSGPQGGRPKGARNKSTEELKRYLASRYRHPLVVLAEMWTRSPAQLAEDLGLYDRQYFEGEEIACHLATGEAAKLQKEALIASLPYWAQKQPIAIEQKGEKRGLLVIGDLHVSMTGDDGVSLPLAPAIDVAAEVVDAAPSEDAETKTP